MREQYAQNPHRPLFDAWEVRIIHADPIGIACLLEAGSREHSLVVGGVCVPLAAGQRHVEHQHICVGLGADVEVVRGDALRHVGLRERHPVQHLLPGGVVERRATTPSSYTCNSVPAELARVKKIHCTYALSGRG